MTDTFAIRLHKRLMNGCGAFEDKPESPTRLRFNFPGTKSKRHRPRPALARLSDRHLPSVIFGGAARDLMVHGPGVEPRDIDIVVDHVSLDELRLIFSDALVRTTRFGGLMLNVDGSRIDIWPLSETWGLKYLHIGNGDFEALTHTTFLNVEAVAVDLTPFRNSARNVYASGFFEALRAKVLDINLPENPFPELSAIRALVTAYQLRFQLSEQLAKYILRQFSKTPLEQFLPIQFKHYGRVPLDLDTIYQWSKAIQSQARTASLVSLPFQEAV